MQELVSGFVAVADEVHFLQRAEGVEGEWFRKVAEQGHYKGRTKPSATRQGIYAVAPSGELLVSVNTANPGRMVKMLQQALERWEELDPEARLLPQAPEAAPAKRFRWEDLYPSDGLALKVSTRDVARTAQSTGWRGRAWNLDYAWFRAAEARSFLPDQIEVGVRHQVPRELVSRLVRCHLLDNVRGQTPPYRLQHVKRAEIETRVTAVKGSLVTLELRGATLAEAEGRWRIRGMETSKPPGDQTRGFDAQLLGYATFDTEALRFSEFEVVMVGVRWGGTRYNLRADDLGPAPLGVVLSLAGDTDAEKVAPANIWSYGWQR